MNSKERVLAAINHKTPDKVPFDLGSTLLTGISNKAYDNILPYLGLKEEKSEIICMDQQLGLPSENFLRTIGADCRAVSIRNSSLTPTEYLENEKYLQYKDGWNMTWQMPKINGHYYDLISSPLKNVESLADLKEKFIYPNPEERKLYAGIRQAATDYDKQGYAVVAHSFTTGLMEMSAWLMGYEKFYMGLGLTPLVIEALMDKILEIKLAYWKNVLAEAGDVVSVVQESDDLGTQSSLLISPKMYRKFIKPRQKILFDFIHNNTKAKIFFHSCGSIYDLIPDLIELGVDILNPIQYTASKMDALNLKKTFGKDLVFWGGGIDTQNILPNGKPQDIKDAVRKQIEILSPDGGFVFAAVHNIQADVPPENILALFSGIAEYR